MMMDYLTKSGDAKLVTSCSHPLTGIACVSRIYSDLAVIDLGTAGATAIELAEGLSLAQLQGMTPGVPLHAA